MKHPLRWLMAAVLVLTAPVASATFHTFQIDEIYSNADGSVQYLVLQEAAGFGGQNFLGGHTLTSTHSGASKMFPFGTDLPSSATAGTRVLIATQGFATLGLVAPDYVIPNGFLATDGGTVNYAGVDQVIYASLPTDGVHAIDRNGNTVQNVATNFGGNSASVSAPTTVISYQGLWWNAPAGSESGWGINFAHQGDVIFVTWFTYDTTGKAWWLSMTADKTANGVYSGTLVQTGGPAFNAVPFDPTMVTRTVVGTGTLTFSDSNNGTFAYTVNGVSQTKAITRQLFASPVPTCTFGMQANLALATNYQDLWWNAPGGSESGWGVNLTHQGDAIFATWFTYGLDHMPLWLSVTANKTANGIYSGTLIQTGGPAFNATPFDPTKVTRTVVGTATFTFSDGNTGTFAYTVNSVAQTKQITRQVFTSPGTVCQ